ncbi:hypothetical protein KVR01_004279 [Diaporthe batatas]|uniref:uncharacterized protein n=1 Tax=Diaporthe batatas TaxID=748121 RepID=UPI001D036C3C|nr:uncharacterized protein KVR01_004279 [Diaporthe batatas]KAG8165727.1 hypothetical protein KVR01_004279 [Diaporthe batatas]
MAPGPILWDGIQFGSMTTSCTNILSWESRETKATRRMAAHARARRRQPSQLWGLAAMLSTAAAVSLNDLQPIANGVLPTSCNMAYNTPFMGCTQADFASGERCSSTCRDGIKTVEDVVNDVCDDVPSVRDSVLDFAQRRVLLLHTCDGNGDDITLAQTTSTTAIIATTSIAPPPTIVVPPPPPPPLTTSIAAPPTVAPSIPVIFTPPALSSTSRSLGSFTIIPTPEPPVTSNTLVVPPVQSTDTATSVITTVIPPLPTTSATTSQLLPPPPSDTQTSSQTVTQSSSTFTTSATAEPSSQDDGGGRGQGRGGGSPFDAQVSLSSRLYCANLPLCLTVGAMLIGFMVR